MQKAGAFGQGEGVRGVGGSLGTAPAWVQGLARCAAVLVIGMAGLAGPSCAERNGRDGRAEGRLHSGSGQSQRSSAADDSGSATGRQHRFRCESVSLLYVPRDAHSLVNSGARLCPGSRLVLMDGSEAVCVGLDGRVRWRRGLHCGPIPVCGIHSRQDSVYLVHVNGEIRELALSDGRVRRTLSLRSVLKLRVARAYHAGLLDGEAIWLPVARETDVLLVRVALAEFGVRSWRIAAGACSQPAVWRDKIVVVADDRALAWGRDRPTAPACMLRLPQAEEYEPLKYVTVDDDTLAFVEDGFFLSVDLRRRKLLAATRMPARGPTDRSILTRGVYVAVGYIPTDCADTTAAPRQAIYGIRADTGKVLWQAFRDAFGLQMNIAHANGQLITFETTLAQDSNHHDVHRLTFRCPATGRCLSEVLVRDSDPPLVHDFLRPPLVVGNRILLVGASGHVVVFTGHWSPADIACSTRAPDAQRRL